MISHVSPTLPLATLACLTLIATACAPAGTAQIADDGQLSPVAEPVPPSKDVTMTDYQDFGGFEPVDEGGLITISNEIGRRPIVLVFYKDHWCDFCRDEFGDLGGLAQEFEQRGARLVPVSADRREAVIARAESEDLDYSALTEEDLAIVDAYNRRQNGDAFEPATFVIAPDGSIVYERLGDTLSDRPSVDEVLEQLDRIAPQEDAAP